MTDVEKLKEQILAVRDTGRTNMLDVGMVQRIAFGMNFFELVMFLEDRHKRVDYAQFIMTGEDKYLEVAE